MRAYTVNSQQIMLVYFTEVIDAVTPVMKVQIRISNEYKYYKFDKKI
ncbi:MAG TPA: hypothetical protein PL029_08700 [Bacteroidia bacterium]|nr:hypothetical protein [Bacteroidia bacterium]